MKFSDLAIDAAALEAGEFRPAVGLPPGHAFKVRGLDTLDYRKLYARLIAELPAEERLAALSPERDDEITAKLLHGVVLQDWQGFVDGAGQPVPYDSDAALAMLSHPDFVRFRRSVLATARDFTAETRAEREAAAKN